MEILKDFGVNWILLLAQVVNFLIVFIILKKVLYKPFLSMLKRREEKVSEGLKAAEEGRKLLEEAIVREKEMLRKTQETSAKIIKDAKSQAKEQAQEIEDTAKKQSEKILADAREKIEQETREASEKLESDIGKIAVAMLEKTLSQVLERKEKSEIIKRVSQRLKV